MKPYREPGVWEYIWVLWVFLFIFPFIVLAFALSICAAIVRETREAVRVVRDLAREGVR